MSSASSGLGRWGSILKQVPAASETSAEVKVLSDDKSDALGRYEEQEEEEESDWRKLLDSGWSKTLRCARGPAAAPEPAKCRTPAPAPGSSLGSCLSLLATAPADEAASADSSAAAKSSLSSAVQKQAEPAAGPTQASGADGGEEEEEQLDLRSFLDAAWSKAKTVKETPPVAFEPEEAECLSDPVEADGGEVEDETGSGEDSMLRDAADDGSAKLDDEDIAVEVTEKDLLEEELVDDDVKDDVSEADNADKAQDAVACDDVELSGQVEEVVTFKGKDVGAVTVQAKGPRPPTFPPKFAAARKPNFPKITIAKPSKAASLPNQAKSFPKPQVRGVSHAVKARVPVAKAALHAVRSMQKVHILHPRFPTHPFMPHHGARAAMIGSVPMRGGRPLAKALWGKAPGHNFTGLPKMRAAPNAFRPPQPKAPKLIARQGAHGLVAPILHKPSQAKPHLHKPQQMKPSAPVRPLPGHQGLQAGLKRQPTDNPQHSLGIKRGRSDDGPLGALDAEGRRFDLKHVVVNFANVGATYGKKVLKRDNCIKPVGLLDWEGVRRCVKCLSQNLGLKVVGVIHENYMATDNNSGGKVPIPQDIRRICESIEETPRLEGANHKSADDEMTIKCAYHRNCRFLDNDNYRDWKQQLRDDRVRAWLEKFQDLLQMRYYFDSGVGIFETIDGNMPPGMLAKDQGAKPVTMAKLWTAPRR